MKRALILGTNAGQADIIEYLKQTGWEVHACGNKKEGPGFELAHRFHQVDTIDVEAVARLADSVKADIVYSVSSDVNIRSATKVSEALNLPVLLGSPIVDLFHFKDRLRGFLNQKNISPVGYRHVKNVSEADDWDIFPCVVKPVDSQGQRGVELLHDKQGIQNAIQVAIENSSTDTAILEEYLEGVEISTNMIVQNHKILVNEFTERLVHGNKFFGLPKGHSIPVRHVSEQNIDEARLMVTALVEELNIKDAVLYIQMIVNHQGPKIVEIAPRLDGCHIWRLLKYAKGYDLRKLAIDCLTGEKVVLPEDVDQKNEPYSLLFHQMPTHAVFDDSAFCPEGGLLFNEYRYKAGEVVQPINGSLEVVGYYIQKD
ncbi:MAG: ATP-grasp domain-containing protein [Bacteroidota bacterium]